jgi:lysophospholipase L1-like esterase
VTAVVFYDENGNGRLDPQEAGRVPGAEVAIGGKTGRAAPLTGRAQLTGVPAGALTATLTAGSLPPYYVAGTAVAVQVPTAEEVRLPATLAIGTNNANLYMAYGDSLTVGEGSSDGAGYPPRLQAKLAAHFGTGFVFNQGRQGNTTDGGVRLIPEALNRVRPAFTLIMLGTNDWNYPACQDSVPCGVIDNLRTIVDACQDRQSLPVLATIPPVNPAINPARNDWVTKMDVYVKQLGREEGILVADVFGAFARAGNLSGYFVDHVHFNDAGYEIVAGAFFDALANGRVGASGAWRTGPAPDAPLPLLLASPSGLPAPGPGFPISPRGANRGLARRPAAVPSEE